MNQEVKKAWVAALRSGDYKQTWKMLRRDQHIASEISYCCLGVLNYCIPGGHDAYYSRTVTKCLSTLVRMNDVELRTFSEIANYIEENL